MENWNKGYLCVSIVNISLFDVNINMNWFLINVDCLKDNVNEMWW